jgi:hypothetical protein
VVKAYWKDTDVAQYVVGLMDWAYKVLALMTLKHSGDVNSAMRVAQLQESQKTV